LNDALAAALSCGLKPTGPAAGTFSVVVLNTGATCFFLTRVLTAGMALAVGVKTNVPAPGAKISIPARTDGQDRDGEQRPRRRDRQRVGADQIAIIRRPELALVRRDREAQPTQEGRT
jgi:hypothetical protein